MTFTTAVRVGHLGEACSAECLPVPICVRLYPQAEAQARHIVGALKTCLLIGSCKKGPGKSDDGSLTRVPVLSGYVTAGKSLSLSELQFSHVQWRSKLASYWPRSPT